MLFQQARLQCLGRLKIIYLFAGGYTGVCWAGSRVGIGLRGLGIGARGSLFEHILLLSVASFSDLIKGICISGW